MNCEDLSKCFEHINDYTNSGSVNFPLIVNTENFSDFQKIRQKLVADPTKSCVYVSNCMLPNGLPNISEAIDAVKGNGDYVIIGLSQALMLQSKDALDRCIDNILGCSIKGHAIVLLSHCRAYLEKYLNNDARLNSRILLLKGEKSELPKLRIAKTKDECIGAYYDGIKDLLSYLERTNDGETERQPVISLVTGAPKAVFTRSVYEIVESNGIYDAIVKKYPVLSATANLSSGNKDNWEWLFKLKDKYDTFNDLIAAKLGAASDCLSKLAKINAGGDGNLRWLLWLSMKVYGTNNNKYLAFALSHSKEYDDLVHHIYQDLLEVNVDDERFEGFFEERKQLISALPQNLSESKKYCDNVGRHGKKAVYYLTGTTEDEEYALMRVISNNEWTDEELLSAVKHGFPELSLYLGEFVFNAENTKLNDSAFCEALTDYFRRYKIQKIENRIKPEFLETVNKYAVERPFYALQPRSSFVSAMQKENVQAYFFDALGVEYLSYIRAKCEEYGLMYGFNIAHCELPSITVKNKEFTKSFDNINEIGTLDELKHHSQKYDYRTCEYPIHVFRELEIIDKELLKIRSQLVQQSFGEAVILSDHGASRLAVIYKHENPANLGLDESGQHSGRCCPCSVDPGIPQAAYEDGYAILANYERFKGGRKANLEVHGGASLEETIVPIITLSLKPDNVEYHFVDSVIKFKIGQPGKIELFSNIEMRQPKLEVEGTFYDGEFTSDKNHAVFTITKQSKAREYRATVYEGCMNTGAVLNFRIERSTKTKDLF